MHYVNVDITGELDSFCMKSSHLKQNDFLCLEIETLISEIYFQRQSQNGSPTINKAVVVSPSSLVKVGIHAYFQ